MSETCGDNRFEIIEKAKQKLLEDTNISSSPDEMKVLDSFLFRCWQMGWLDGRPEVAYLCDGKACEVCPNDNGYRLCRRTTDIRHAVDFEEISPGKFMQKEVCE